MNFSKILSSLVHNNGWYSDRVMPNLLWHVGQSLGYQEVSGLIQYLDSGIDLVGGGTWGASQIG